jgi:branched-subunit amino acid aminotransferase/4-amino-4-deoxychorismate lyase
MEGLHVEVNGAVVDEPSWSETSSFGHFTAMQVRDRATRGLELHLHRLEAANREMFGVGLERELVRDLIRRAMREVMNASVRVYIVERQPEPAIVVTVKAPGGIRSPQRLRSVDYLRPQAHLKHLATEQAAQTQAAQRGGDDDALLTDGLDVVSEAATANIGLFDADGIVWPKAPLLRGITMQLLEAALPDRGVSVRHASLRLRDLRGFDGAFLSNARGIAAVSTIDGEALPDAADRIAVLLDAYAAVPWDPI